MKVREVIYIAAAVVAFKATAGQPYAVKDCGFDSSSAVSNGIAGYVAGQIVDCLLWGCIPIIGPFYGGARVLKELDFDCAGAVYQGTRHGRFQYTIRWDADSVAAARNGGLAYCQGRLNSCELILVFRHAAAGYWSAVGKQAYWAQGADLSTAREIARARCERATGSPCELALEAENAG